MEIFSIYVCVFVIFFILLNMNVIRNRRKTGVSVGDGNQEDLIRARSMYYNFFEFALVFLLVLGVADYYDLSDVMLHGCAIGFFLARALHAFSIQIKKGLFRIIAIATSFSMIIILTKAVVFHLFKL